MEFSGKRAIVKMAREHIDSNEELTQDQRIAAKAAAEGVVDGLPNNALYRAAVISVALIAVLLVVGSLMIILSPAIETSSGQMSYREVPDFFSVAMGAAIGALAGMLANTAS